jgi:hypothetical protein
LDVLYLLLDVPWASMLAITGARWEYMTGWAKLAYATVTVGLVLLSACIHRRREVKDRQSRDALTRMVNDTILPDAIRQRRGLLTTLATILAKENAASFPNVFRAMGNRQDWYASVQDEIGQTAQMLTELQDRNKGVLLTTDTPGRKAWRAGVIDVVARLERCCWTVGAARAEWRSDWHNAHSNIYALIVGYDSFKGELFAYAQQHEDRKLYRALAAPRFVRDMLHLEPGEVNG